MYAQLKDIAAQGPAQFAGSDPTQVVICRHVSSSLLLHRILLVTCHLAAHDEFLDRRNADYARIAGELATVVGHQQLPLQAGWLPCSLSHSCCVHLT
jgi:hypothetical protein